MKSDQVSAQFPFSLPKGLLGGFEEEGNANNVIRLGKQNHDNSLENKKIKTVLEIKEKKFSVKDNQVSSNH